LFNTFSSAPFLTEAASSGMREIDGCFANAGGDVHPITSADRCLATKPVDFLFTCLLPSALIEKCFRPRTRVIPLVLLMVLMIWFGRRQSRRYTLVFGFVAFSTPAWK
jgi:hypothetical protein